MCPRPKTETLSRAKLLQPQPIPYQIWDDITMDFIDGFPSSQGKNAILVAVDRPSESSHFIALSHPYTVMMISRSGDTILKPTKTNTLSFMLLYQRSSLISKIE